MTRLHCDDNDINMSFFRHSESSWKDYAPNCDDSVLSCPREGPSLSWLVGVPRSWGFYPAE